jgi:hypothetical protein
MILELEADPLENIRYLGRLPAGSCFFSRKATKSLGFQQSLIGWDEPPIAPWNFQNRYWSFKSLDVSGVPQDTFCPNGHQVRNTDDGRSILLPRGDIHFKLRKQSC